MSKEVQTRGLEDIIHTASLDDKQNYAFTWIRLIQDAAKSFYEMEYTKYFRCIDILIVTLVPELRKQVKQYQKDHIDKSDKLDYYNNLFEYVIDVLDKKGYLTRNRMYEIGAA